MRTSVIWLTFVLLLCLCSKCSCDTIDLVKRKRNTVENVTIISSGTGENNTEGFGTEESHYYNNVTEENDWINKYIEDNDGRRTEGTMQKNLEHFDMRKYKSRLYIIEGTSALELFIISAVKKSVNYFMMVHVYSYKNTVHPGLSRMKEGTEEVNTQQDNIDANNTSTIQNFGFAVTSIYNFVNETQPILVIAKEYTHNEPTPGGHHIYPFPRPNLKLNIALMLTTVRIYASDYMYYTHEGDFCDVNNDTLCERSSNNTNPSDVPNSRYGNDSNLKIVSPRYEVYVSNLDEYSKRPWTFKFFDMVEVTSNPETISQHATLLYKTELDEEENSFDISMISYTGHGQVVNVKVYYNETHSALYSAALTFGCPANDETCAKFPILLFTFLCSILAITGILTALVSCFFLEVPVYFGFFLFCWLSKFILFTTITSHKYIYVSPLATFGTSILSTLIWRYIIRKYHSIHYWFTNDFTVHNTYIALFPIRILGSTLIGLIISYHFRVFGPIPGHKPLLTVSVPLMFTLIIFMLSCRYFFMILYLSTFVGIFCALIVIDNAVGGSAAYILIDPIASITVSKYARAVGVPPYKYPDFHLSLMWIYLPLVAHGLQLLLLRGLGRRRRCRECMAGVKPRFNIFNLCKPYNKRPSKLPKRTPLRENPQLKQIIGNIRQIGNIWKETPYHIPCHNTEYRRAKEKEISSSSLQTSIQLQSIPSESNVRTENVAKYSPQHMRQLQKERSKQIKSQRRFSSEILSTVTIENEKLESTSSSSKSLPTEMLKYNKRLSSGHSHLSVENVTEEDPCDASNLLSEDVQSLQ